MYYSSSENKGADQLRGYREADLRLCFRLCRLLVFPWGGSYVDIVDWPLYTLMYNYICCSINYVDSQYGLNRLLLTFIVILM